MKAVPCGASFIATIGADAGAARRPVIGAKTMPPQLRTIKAIFPACMRRGEDQIAFVFAVVVIGDDNDFALRKGVDRAVRRTGPCPRPPYFQGKSSKNHSG